MTVKGRKTHMFDLIYHSVIFESYYYTLFKPHNLDLKQYEPFLLCSSVINVFLAHEFSVSIKHPGAITFLKC